ncbi:MAG: hypothetical protein QF859_01565 [Candidatus Marinimicrobia bacterium]|jgi:hypothetical protein|nr:hypothetical protein [Candidatus Neomarinimicrobiota bacterium]MDP6261985.1 hypothetical protein [Candidatus Neomarinimicrobiota bacterium]MDP7474639.1 hypothetical protein [Candidatus Neomarinimicrobiota bacterium]MEE1506522.1 hypothetical protein [Candidatus Neomarinimicrobiota bacterium]MEE1573662.1 hypothetical protein [Candidatus Neomarinimicrobiota bacterium]
MTKYPARIIFFTLLLLYACSKEVNDISRSPIEIPEDNIIAKIGDKIITVEEFIKRSEYTVRPAYCRGDNIIHKKIILNSLIGEKLLSLEAMDISLSPHLMKYLKGRKEQAMRELLSYEKGYKDVQISPETLDQFSSTADRKYKVQFCRLPDSGVADEIYHFMEQGFSYEEIFDAAFGLDSIPERSIDFFSEEDPFIIENIFSEKLEKNEVLSPFKANDGSYLWIKVKGWTKTPAITASSQKVIRQDINEKLNRLEAVRKYNEYTAGLMAGKKMDLIEPAFSRLMEVASNYYLGSVNDNKLIEAIWNIDEEIVEKPDFAEMESYDEKTPFMYFDERTWSIGEIQELIDSHPLVFRKKRIKKNEFPEQLKFALADLMRDHYLTAEAYKMGYDKHHSVLLEEYLWEDHLYASLKKEQILEKKELSVQNNEDHLNVMGDYIGMLQEKYSRQITINFRQFNKINLSHIDMVALKPSAPYSHPVPSFPILTQDHSIDYGKEISLSTEQ